MFALIDAHRINITRGKYTILARMHILFLSTATGKTAVRYPWNARGCDWCTRISGCACISMQRCIHTERNTRLERTVSFRDKNLLRFLLISVRPSRWKNIIDGGWTGGKNGWIGSKRPLRPSTLAGSRGDARADANGGRGSRADPRS